MKRSSSLFCTTVFLISMPFYAGCSKYENTLAPDFALRVMGGGGDEWYDKVISLGNLRGQPVVIHFTASWCYMCKHIFDTIKNHDSSAFVMGIGVLDRKDKFRAYLLAERFSVPVGFDEDGIIAKEYHVNTLPMTIFIDRNGIIRERLIGMVSGERLNDAMKKIL
ncbi:MAG: TlpA family protein disulfide reductase [Deltaproteobacteria bacterium]|nr:TlpA family protein disulfide reductase [Deltaproteobacteria bacterium]